MRKFSKQTLKQTTTRREGRDATQLLRSARALRTLAALVLIAVAVLLPRSANSAESVSVLYAGSLAGVMENGVGPAFIKTTGIAYEGEAQGSLGGARMIRDKLRFPDVYISADPAVNAKVLMGPANGNLVNWYLLVGGSQLVLGVNPASKFAAKFDDVRSGKMTWYELLETPGFRFGRGDPTIDPKGYRTIFMFNLAGKFYKRPDIPALLGEPRNPAEVFPEIVLLARLESGEFDAAIFYKHEALAHKMPFITLPPEINLGDPKFAASYATQTYDTPGGEHVVGAPILFTITIPTTVRHEAAALAFVKFVLSSDALLKDFGFSNVAHQVGGDAGLVPPELRGFIDGAFHP
ncbi:MAG TPA: extracellular solute-binding protein [Candidatus Acidoferrales bacterium]